MELTTLRYFVEVAKTGNITKTAKKLHISQPAISRQIKLLESELGQSLFTRSLHCVCLTKTGELFLKKAEVILKLSESAINECSRKDTNVRGSLVLGFINDSFSNSLSDVLSNFHELYPSIDIEFYNGGFQHIHNLLNNGSIDVICSIQPHNPHSSSFIKTKIKKKIGILMKDSDILTDYDIITEEIYNNIQLIVPCNPLFDGIYKEHFSSLNTSNILVHAESPIRFFHFIKDNLYILSIEPSERLLLSTGLTFRPIDPEILCFQYFIKSDNSANPETANAFMSFIENALVD